MYPKVNPTLGKQESTHSAAYMYVSQQMSIKSHCNNDGVCVCVNFNRKVCILTWWRHLVTISECGGSVTPMCVWNVFSIM